MTLMTRAEDVTGKPCCIVYEECFLELAKMKVIIGFYIQKISYYDDKSNCIFKDVS